MNSRETLAFAKRLMREVWEPFDAEAVPRGGLARGMYEAAGATARCSVRR